MNRQPQHADLSSPDASDRFNALPALRRAAQRAREIAYQTGTPLIVAENGRVVEHWVTDDPRMDGKEG
jgi:hypothetical protein